MNKQPPCPECEKLAAVPEESNKIIGEFLSWLESKYYICEFVEDRGRWGKYVPESKTVNWWLAEYYNIDLDKVEKERRALLDWLREKGG